MQTGAMPLRAPGVVRLRTPDRLRAAVGGQRRTGCHTDDPRGGANNVPASRARLTTLIGSESLRKRRLIASIYDATL